MNPETNAVAQTKRGYIIDEDDDYALQDLARAMGAVAMMLDDRENDMMELTGGDLASLLRIFGRCAQNIHDKADFANQANVKPRHLN